MLAVLFVLFLLHRRGLVAQQAHPAISFGQESAVRCIVRAQGRLLWQKGRSKQIRFVPSKSVLRVAET